MGNALALLALAWPGRSRRWALAVAGSLAFLLAGLVIGTQGDWLGVPRVDFFHLCLASAVLAWVGARLRERGSGRRALQLLDVLPQVLQPGAQALALAGAGVVEQVGEQLRQGDLARSKWAR